MKRIVDLSEEIDEGYYMNKISLILLAAVTMTLQACTYEASYSRYPVNYGYAGGYSANVNYCPPTSSYQRSYNRPYNRPYNSYQQPYQNYTVGPQYYRSRVPYYGQNVKNYTDAPIIMPSCGGGSNRIIPASWD